MKTAVLLCSMGGPINQEAVRPFLFRLFHDPAIINLPEPLRWSIAKLISWKRTPEAKQIYQKMGGGSPILAHTLAQAIALEQNLKNTGEYRCFVGMSYATPLIEDTVKQIMSERFEKIILLPLYPQFSTTTTAPVLRDTKTALQKFGFQGTFSVIESYPKNKGFVQSSVKLIQEKIEQVPPEQKIRLLFSAHGLPEKIVRRGDPYPQQCEQTFHAIVRKLNRPEIESKLCYQSRVGPLKWIGPATDAEVIRGAQEGRALILVPIAFVSDHSETLVELGQTYRSLAARYGAPFYAVTPAVGTTPDFIDGLAQEILKH